MFYGESEHSMDAKGRVFVPKRFQDELTRAAAGQLCAILTPGFEGCLFLFSKTGFEKVLERLQTQSFGGEQLRRMQRLFFGALHEAELDSAGRLLVPERLKKAAGLDKDLILLGAAERAEIWDKQRWLAYQAKAAADFNELDHVLIGGQAPVPPGGMGRPA